MQIAGFNTGPNAGVGTDFNAGLNADLKADRRRRGLCGAKGGLSAGLEYFVIAL